MIKLPDPALYPESRSFYVPQDAHQVLGILFVLPFTLLLSVELLILVRTRESLASIMRYGMFCHVFSSHPFFQLSPIFQYSNSKQGLLASKPSWDVEHGLIYSLSLSWSSRNTYFPFLVRILLVFIILYTVLYHCRQMEEGGTLRGPCMGQPATAKFGR
jgi:hypothetical protein